MDEGARYRQAKQRAEALKGFYKHVAIYLIVNTGLLLINLATGGGLWFYWPMLGWGIGLAVQAVNVFIFSDRLGPGWEERKIREYMGHDAPPAPPSHPA